MRFCEECGAQLEDGALFCEECGTPVENLEEQPVAILPVTEAEQLSAIDEETPIIEEVVAEEPVEKPKIVLKKYIAEEPVAKPKIILKKYIAEEPGAKPEPVVEEYIAEEPVEKPEPVVEEHIAEEPVVESFEDSEPVAQATVEAFETIAAPQKNKKLIAFISIGAAVAVLVVALIIVIAVVVPKVKNNNTDTNNLQTVDIDNSEKDDEDKHSSKKDDKDDDEDTKNQEVEPETEPEPEPKPEPEQEAEQEPEQEPEQKPEQTEGEPGEEQIYEYSDPFSYCQMLDNGMPNYYYNYASWYSADSGIGVQTSMEIYDYGGTIYVTNYDANYNVSYKLECNVVTPMILGLDYSGNIYDADGIENYISFTLYSSGGAWLSWYRYNSDGTYFVIYEDYMTLENNMFMY